MEPLTFEQFKVTKFKEDLENRDGMITELKQDPEKVLKNYMQQNPLETDKWIYRIIVISLGLTIIATIIGVLILIGTGKIGEDKSVPTILTAIGSAAIGALAGLLAPPPKKG